jgi:arylsulfatase
VEWLVAQEAGGPRALVWTAATYAVISTTVALIAGVIGRVTNARQPGRLEPIWLWALFWLGSYGVFQANVLILPRQGFLTLPSLALTAATLLVAMAAASVVATGIRAVAPALNRPFMRPIALAVSLVSAAVTVIIPLTLPRNDLTAHHQSRTPGQTSALVIVVDTLRSDHLSCYGYERPTSPRIDAIAARGTRFESAWSPSSWTVPAVASLFSGLPLSSHHAGAAEKPFDTEPTLAAQLSRAGVVTAAFSANPLVSPMFGFERGFDLFVSYRTGLVNPLLDLSAETTLGRVLRREIDGDRLAVDQARRWLETHRDDRFFLYIQLFAPHRPYAPPGDFRARFVDAGYRGIEYEGAAAGEQLEPHVLANITQRYDAEIAYADSLVGEMTDELARLGIDRTTSVIVTSDHGEAFGEHGNWEHGQTLYVEETHIPLIARLAGGQTQRVIETPVSLTDLHTTLLDLLGAEHSTATAGGRVSLLPSMLDGAEPPLRPIISELLAGTDSIHPTTAEAVTLGAARLVHNVTRGTTELFDRARDPAERQPVSSAELSRLLGGFLTPQWWESRDAVTERVNHLSEEDIRQLRSLGYVR